MTYALLALAGAAALALAGYRGLLHYLHRQIFKPARSDAPLHPHPGTLGIPFEDVFFHTPSGLRLHGWWLPRDGAAFTLLFCHGNRGNLSDRVDSCALYHRLGLNVFALDYRGYGRSEGRPSESGLYEDARAAWDWLRDERGLAAGRIVILGRSLGGAVASHLASVLEADEQPAAVIIESTFTSIAAMARERYPRLPMWRVRGPRFDNVERIGRIAAPLLLVHSEQDAVIGFHHGRALAASAGRHHHFMTIGGPHAGGHLESGAAYETPLRAFLAAAGVELASDQPPGEQRSR